MDQKLLLLINREWTNPFLDRVMTIFSSFAFWTGPLILLVLVLLWRGGFRERAFVLTAIFIVGFNDGLISNPIKHFADRPRPFQSHNDVRMLSLARGEMPMVAAFKPLRIQLSRTSIEDVQGRSFPSSHTINMVSLALVCAAFYRRLGWLAFFPAFLVGYSRIYTGSHWPSDVGVSIFIALGATLLLLAGAEGLWRRFVSRRWPAFFVAHPSLLAREDAA